MNQLKFININDRRIIEGPRDHLMQISPVKYPNAMRVLDKMMRNNWFHWDAPITDDVGQWKTLPENIRRAVQLDIAFLSNLDGIQFGNLMFNIGRHITAPEYAMAISRQAWEEAVHVISYETMIETLDMDPVETYNLFLNDEILRAKNEHILRMSQMLSREYTPENFVRALAGNVALEGIYFQAGFKLFYVLHRQGILPNCAKMIRYINRDESNHHLDLFYSLWRDLRAERPELFTPEVATDCRNILAEAARFEITWGTHMVGGGIPGYTPAMIDGHVKALADLYSQKLGLGTIFGQTTDPMDWCEPYMRQHGVETNFFEDKPIEYEDKSLEW